MHKLDFVLHIPNKRIAGVKRPQIELVKYGFINKSQIMQMNLKETFCTD